MKSIAENKEVSQYAVTHCDIYIYIYIYIYGTYIAHGAHQTSALSPSTFKLFTDTAPRLVSQCIRSKEFVARR
jgi:hypothetical protein